MLAIFYDVGGDVVSFSLIALLKMSLLPQRFPWTEAHEDEGQK